MMASPSASTDPRITEYAAKKSAKWFMPGNELHLVRFGAYLNRLLVRQPDASHILQALTELSLLGEATIPRQTPPDLDGIRSAYLEGSVFFLHALKVATGTEPPTIGREAANYGFKRVIASRPNLHELYDQASIIISREVSSSAMATLSLVPPSLFDTVANSVIPDVVSSMGKSPFREENDKTIGELSTTIQEAFPAWEGMIRTTEPHFVGAFSEGTNDQALARQQLVGAAFAKYLFTPES